MKWMIYRVTNGWLITSETSSMLAAGDIYDCHVFVTLEGLAAWLKQTVEAQPRNKGRFSKKP